ncbi:hypothetical protein GH714_024067 [Hevea brasiliensis]|uniref:DUF4283 domain-containing protein n=1 Tax=Hevea brasiliensis TaxID=3981 RepID=A0A6A6KTQ0_HEVBR|nr:hypothetical protein GH714_024067 [Hevea brasiliensis]
MTENLSCEEPHLELATSTEAGHQMTGNKLVARVIASRKYNPWILRTTVGKVWKNENAFQVRRGPEGTFIFIFEDMAEKVRIVDKGPWLIDNNLLVLKEWPPDISIKEINFNVDAFWDKKACLVGRSKNPKPNIDPIALLDDNPNQRKNLLHCPDVANNTSDMALPKISSVDSGIELDGCINDKQLSSPRIASQKDYAADGGSGIALSGTIMGVKRPWSSVSSLAHYKQVSPVKFKNWDKRKQVFQNSLAQLHVPKPNPLDTEILEPKPLDFLVHLACSMLKPETIVSGPNPKEIAGILNIQEPHNLLGSKKVNFELINEKGCPSDENQHKANSGTTLEIHKVTEEDSLSPFKGSTTSNRKWKRRARDTSSSTSHDQSFTGTGNARAEIASSQNAGDDDLNNQVEIRNTIETSEALVAGQKPPQVP